MTALRELAERSVCVDMAMQLNRAFFVQNGRCGYVLKPYVMWTQEESIDFNRYNPWDVEMSGMPPLNLTIKVLQKCHKV